MRRLETSHCPTALVLAAIVGSLDWTTLADTLHLAGPGPQPPLSAAGPSHLLGLSRGGRFVTFLSSANNLATNDDALPWLDVFVRDLGDNRTTLVSVTPVRFGGGNDHSVAPSISSNGQWVAFESAAENLVADDTNRFSDVFIRDLAASVTHAVSVTTNGWLDGNGPSGNPLLSADGRWVVFESGASN